MMFEEIVFLLLLALSTQIVGIRGLLFKRLFSLDSVKISNDILHSFPNNGSIPDCSRLCHMTGGCEYFRIHSGICTLFNSHPHRTGVQSGAIFYIKYESSCPTSQGYTFESSIPLCFKLSDTKQNWTTAHEVCQESGSQLLVLNTEKRHTFMLNYLQGVEVHTIWVGLHRDKFGMYTWYDGSTFVYKWDHDEPSVYQICGAFTASHRQLRHIFMNHASKLKFKSSKFKKKTFGDESLSRLCFHGKLKGNDRHSAFLKQF